MTRIFDNNRLIAVVVIAIVTFAGVVLFAQQSKANPSLLTSTAQSAAATSTRTYLSPGAATTTLVYDAYESAGTNQTNNGNTNLPNRLSLVIQEDASSTSSVLNIAIEHATVCNLNVNITTSLTACDWYQDDVLTSSGAFLGTTTNPADISSPLTFKWTFASSTLGGDASASSSASKVITVPVTSRYTRAVFTNTGARLGIWAQFVPMKERGN